MSILYALTLGLLLIGQSYAEDNDYVEGYFDQKIDHFNFLSNGNQTYKQRYLFNASWWDVGRGPIFFYVGNEGDIVGLLKNNGFIFKAAKQFNALALFVEHRYYGKSLPFGNDSFKGENIGLLSVNQALSDYAFFLRRFQETHKADKCPIIAFGGSYGGILAAYMRFKYPNIILGSIAASAPLLQVAGKVSGDIFFQVVTKRHRFYTRTTMKLPDLAPENLVPSPPILIIPYKDQVGEHAKFLLLEPEAAEHENALSDCEDSSSKEMNSLETENTDNSTQNDKDFSDISPQCEAQVRSAFSQLDKWAAMGQAGYSEIERTFRLCKPLKSVQDYDHLLRWARNAFVSVAMMDYPYPASAMGSLPAFPVKVMCNLLQSAPRPADGLREAVALYYNASGTESCFDIYQEYIYCADPTGCGLGFDATAWDYQACTEINLEGSTWGTLDMFPVLPFTPQMRDEYCYKTYKVLPRRNYLDVQYWGADISSASNIVFSNGNLDPWAPGGILKNISDTLVAVMIDGGAHHLDFKEDNPNDPASVRVARDFELANISKWLREYYEKLYQ